MLAGLAAKALPTIFGGFATGVVSGAIKRAVDGDGLYLHKLGHCVKVDSVRGNDLYLTPHKNLSGVSVVFEKWFNDSRRIRIDIGTKYSFQF